MTESERTATLAGLVSAGADEIYQRLRATGALRAGSAHGEVDPDDPAVAELLDLGVAFRSGPGDRLIRPVDPAVALRLLIEARQSELISFQSRILDGWTRLSGMLPSVLDGGTGGKVDGVRVLTRTEEVVTRAAELCSAPKVRLRGTETGSFPRRDEDRLRVPPPASLRAGVRYQLLYEIDCQRTEIGASTIDRCATAGAQTRLRVRLPVRMLHVDDAVALLAADRSTATAVLVQAPAILAMLAEWFDLLWDHPTTMVHPVGGRRPGLTAVQREVLKLMLTGDDGTIARRLELSVTTVRRHIKAIYGELGVNSRFAAGMAAAKLNWI